MLLESNNDFILMVQKSVILPKYKHYQIDANTFADECMGFLDERNKWFRACWEIWSSSKNQSFCFPSRRQNRSYAAHNEDFVNAEGGQKGDFNDDYWIPNTLVANDLVSKF